MRQRRVAQIDLKTGEVIKTFESVREASKSVSGVNSAGAVVKACNGQIKQFKGYMWKYVDDDQTETTLSNEINRLRGVIDMMLLVCPKCNKKMEFQKENTFVCHKCMVIAEQRSLFRELEVPESKCEILDRKREERAEFGFYVKTQREELHNLNKSINKKRFAELMYITPSTLHGYENGKSMPRDMTGFKKRLKAVREMIKNGEFKK